METKALARTDALALLGRRLHAALGRDLARLVVLREDLCAPETMHFPIVLVAVLRDEHRADEVTNVVVEVNLETDHAHPAFAYAVSEAAYEGGSSLKAQIARKGLAL